ncbi:unnamed protein product [Protopolystoma xenopodis]|uniref:Uncharacterized protein n=1 Tax=Protopolystoma xenopodis TaxID=117903 RepID=A0A3S5BRQ9_9PLAT|nr:unnamed protein product [Protopolystoma xenopodis]
MTELRKQGNSPLRPCSVVRVLISGIDASLPSSASPLIFVSPSRCSYSFPTTNIDSSPDNANRIENSNLLTSTLNQPMDAKSTSRPRSHPPTLITVDVSTGTLYIFDSVNVVPIEYLVDKE